MHLDVWRDLRSKGFPLPQGADLESLTDELLAMLASPDGEVRDNIAYEALATWVSGGRYDAGALSDLGDRMVDNLRRGLGERTSDGVFLRAFSILILGEIIALDAKERLLAPGPIHAWTCEAIRYLRLERDERGYVPGHGWAHASAHTADCLGAIAAHPETGVEGLLEILSAVADRILRPGAEVFIHDEDERLAYACLAVLRRPEITFGDADTWLHRFTRAEDGNGSRAASDENSSARTRLNAKSFLRSLYFQLLWTQGVPSPGDALAAAVLRAVRATGTSLYGQKQ